MDKPVKDWGKGIPEYKEDDLLKGLELHAFCTNIAARAMQDEGYTIEGVVIDRTPTQVIANKDGKRYVVIAAGGIFPFRGVISYRLKREFSDFCHSKDVTPMFASVALMSNDPDRAAAGLALKYDGYGVTKLGIQDLSEVQIPDKGTNNYQTYCTEMIRDAYCTGDFQSLYDLFSDDVELHSFWVKEPTIGKQEVMAYYDKKGQAIKNSNSKIGGSIVVITSNSKKIRNAKVNGETANVIIPSEFGKVCVLLSQENRGEVNWILITPSFNKDNQITKVSISDPALFDFGPFYAFE